MDKDPFANYRPNLLPLVQRIEVVGQWIVDHISPIAETNLSLSTHIKRETEPAA